jgi:hypothetical protein
MSDNLSAALGAAKTCDRIAFNNAIQNELLDRVNQSLETMKMKYANSIFDDRESQEAPAVEAEE